MRSSFGEVHDIAPATLTVRTAVQVADFAPGEAYGPRVLPDFELVWVLHGSAQWSTQPLDPDGPPETHLLGPGTIALGQRGSLERYAWTDSMWSRHAYVHVRVEDPGRLGDPVGWPRLRSATTAPVLGALCDYLVELAAHDTVWARTRSDELVAMLLDLFIRGPLDNEPDPLPDPLARVIDHVWRVWRRDGARIVEVPRLAEAAGLSVGHLHQLFRDQFGCGPAHAFELIRLARAAVALQRTNASLSEVADSCGFANAYHFSRRFAQAYGVPPGRFRRQDHGQDPIWPVRAAGLMPIAYLLLRRRDNAE